ncbi:MAG: Nif3-like dinuclear metal center hexameric protein [Acidobacteria bacterium]|jgi:dinuclear metal center YbgI/SA1388 family protein|nr:Nif3-like dinuclear metal center hexameric protein [Acidobacteriota bacterium]
MILRDNLNRFLAGLYNYENFDDHCQNGLQVEGKDKIEKIIFGVSFNQPFLEAALQEKPDALIVHHGIFQQGVFKLTGILKQKIKMLLDNDISLFGIHLPMDAHPALGHNALLLSAIGAGNIESFNVGFCGENVQEHPLEYILEIFHQQLHPHDYNYTRKENENSIFALTTPYGFTVLRNGPQVPKKIGIITGGASAYYEKAIEKGVDTFFCGEIKEKIPALSLETHTNYINLGHYFSEKPGILALEKTIAEKFAVQTAYIEIANPV